ncbi:MAG: preprotein translocase subunit SecG [Planctomycetota bacterium]|jgi:preprotein translocase subunit SecG
MNMLFFVLTVVFIIAATVMVLIILVQRPQGGGLAGAFGGAGGGGTDTVFGGRVGDALTTMTVVAFGLYLVLAVALNRIPAGQEAVADATDATSITGDLDADRPLTAPGGDQGAAPPPVIVDEAGLPLEVTPIDAPPADFLERATEEGVLPAPSDPRGDPAAADEGGPEGGQE